MTEPLARGALVVRDATPADLDAVYDVWYATEVDGMDDPPPPRTMPWFGHLVRTARLVVAEHRRQVIGFAGLLDHGRCVALSDLFVHPSRQSRGIGAALLDAVLPPGRPAVTMASADPRAVGSYARRGLRPRWPAYYLAADRGAIRRWPARALEVEPLAPGEYRWELPGDESHYAAVGARPVAIHRDRQRVGTALVLTGNPQRLLHPESTEVLESTAGREVDAAGLVLAVVAQLLDEGAPRVVVMVPAPHPALAPLLAAGFRITDVDMACASEDGLLADPSRHTGHGEARVAGPG